MLMDKQGKITPRRGMPVDLTDVAKRNVVRSAETIQLYYFNSSTYTIDGGQAAGTAVFGKTAYAPILSTLGLGIASKGNTSLYFTSTALTTEVELEDSAFEAADYKSAVDALKHFTDNLSNGEYVVDYRNGNIYGKKASTASTLTAASYRVKAITTFEFSNTDWNSPSSSPSTSLSSSPSSSASTSISSSPSTSASTSLSSSPSTSLSSSPSTSPSASESPSTSLSSSPSASESPSTSESSSISSSPSVSPSSSRSVSPSASVSPSTSPSSSASSSPSASPSA